MLRFGACGQPGIYLEPKHFKYITRRNLRVLICWLTSLVSAGDVRNAHGRAARMRAPRRLVEKKTVTVESTMARLDWSSREMVECAAQGGAPDAIYELGLMYCAGRDVELNLVEAHKWFNIAAMRGNEDAKRYRSEISGEMSKSQIAEAQRLAREWLRLH